ncbi:inositol monophosphatase family protein [Streptomyces albofaciens]|uniref:inositol monophosphatase family protein n=1 Tax=Streptomyces albofaciens TaxID=66866 RepID=UPI001FCA7509|nr:inositol monophosphatase family protein [Streptomyces albofaciens]
MDHSTDAPPVSEELFAFAVRLAARAGRMCAEAFHGEQPSSEREPDGTAVTAVDIAVEEFVRKELAAAFPADAVLGEEAGARAGTSGRRWVIDPVNGTRQFTDRVPAFSTGLAHEDEHGPAIGVVSLPMSRQLVAAGRGLGCRLLLGTDPDPLEALRSGRGRLRAGGRTELTGARTQAHGIAGWPEPLLTALHRRVRLVQGGGGALDVLTGRADALVIAGPATGYAGRAPLPVIVAEGGGRITDLTGAPVLEGDGSVLVTNGHLHDAFLEAVAEALEEGSTRAVLVDARPGWAAEGAALAEELLSALAPEARRVEHIGSTSVPGMAAKPVFDLQVSVADLAAAADSFDAPLAARGFVRSRHESDHVPAGRDDDPARWAKRLWTRRGGPGPDVNLHVRCAGSPNERLALLFRDWFRAHPEAVPAYARFKRELAQRTADSGSYAETKDPVVDLVVEVAEGWARETGWRP